MSKQIQKLAEIAKKQVPAGLVVDKWIEKYNEIFARLIIDECAKLMHEHEKLPEGNFGTKPAFMHELIIKTHFNIEQ